MVKLCTATSPVFIGKRTYLPKHVKATLSAIANRKKKQKPAPPAPRSSHIEWNYPAELFAFSARLGESVNESGLRRALTERSYMLQSQEERQRLGLPDTEANSADNSELADRGSQLMTSYIAGWLRAALPRLPEEGVQAVTSYLTSQDQLYQLAVGLGLKDLVLSQEYPPSEEAMARCLRAFVASLAEASGETRAQLFVRDFVLARLTAVDLNSVWEIEEPLSVLSDALSRCGRAPPEPRLLRSAGPGSLLAAYVVGVYSDRKLLSYAPGDSVSEATALAARAGLNQLMGVSESSAPLDIRTERSPQPAPAASLADWRPLL